MNVMIDSNIFDKLYENKDGITKNIINLVRSGVIKIYCTPIQKEELCAISNNSDKANWSLSFFEQWTKFVSPPFAWGIPGAGWGQSSFSSQYELNQYDKIMPDAEYKNHVKDKLIALSAARSKDKNNDTVAFVTEDR